MLQRILLNSCVCVWELGSYLFAFGNRPDRVFLGAEISSGRVEPLFFRFKIVSIPFQILLIPFFSVSDLKNSVSDMKNHV